MRFDVEYANSITFLLVATNSKVAFSNYRSKTNARFFEKMVLMALTV